MNDIELRQGGYFWMKDPFSGEWVNTEQRHLPYAEQILADRNQMFIQQYFDAPSGRFRNMPKNQSGQDAVAVFLGNEQEDNIWDAISPDGSGGGAQSQENQQLYDSFSGALNNAIAHPGLSAEAEQQMVNRGSEGLTEAEQQAQLEAAELAGAMGFGESGDRLTASREIGQQYATQRNAAERDTRLNIENQRQAQLLQALGIGGSYLTSANQLSASQNNRAQDMLLDYYKNGGSHPSGGFGEGGGGNMGYAQSRSGGPPAGSSGLGSIYGHGYESEEIKLAEMQKKINAGQAAVYRAQQSMMNGGRGRNGFFAGGGSIIAEPGGKPMNFDQWRKWQFDQAKKRNPQSW